ncbi:hypothetical protein [Microbacterium enclense]|uniref:hypothetical protein n=1 Tax=Microbacterium enclense TaxID=993073 RepID=UPI003F7F3393
MRRAVVYLVLGLLSFAAAVATYPFFFSQGYKGFEDNPPTVIVIVSDSLGKAPSVEIAAPRNGSIPVLTVSQADVSRATSPQATIYLAIERWVKDAEFAYTPLDCSSDQGEPTFADVKASDPINRAGEQGVMTSGLTTSGNFTAVTFESPVEGPSISCPLEAYGFSQESIAVSSVYIPGIEAYALNGGEEVTRSYTIGRGPADYIERASEQPSEVLATAFTWYERDFDFLARQGLFVSVSSPQAQQDSAYRLFVAGALVGLGGGLVVAAIQVATEPRRLAR